MYKLISHRGLHNKNIIENSFLAISNALNNNNYVGVEFDVRCTLDNEFIVYHDAMYDGKLIKKIMYNELPKYIPRLKDILNIGSNKMFLIEIKDINDNYSKLIKLLKKYQNKKIYIMSFSNNIVNKLNFKNKKYKLEILNFIYNINKNINNLDFVCILNSLLNKKIINTLHDKEIFLYGLFSKKEFLDVFYIVD